MATLSFFGDVFLSGKIVYKVSLPDGFVFNLEGPVTESLFPVKGKICLRMSPGCIESAFSIMPKAVCLGNNHIMDYGLNGLNDTFNYLKSLGIPYFGAGTIEDNCNNPIILNVNNFQVALAAYVCPTTNPHFADADSPGVAPIDLERIRKDIMIARTRGATRFIVNLHWGVEEVGYMRPQDFDIGCQILALGADLVVGHHAHCIQPILLKNGKFVFFGLGNAIFPDIDQTVLGKAKWTKNRFWNNTSLVVHYDVKRQTAYWTWQALKNDRVVSVNKPFIGSILLKTRARDYIEKAYIKHYLFARLRYAVSRFLARPKFSSLSPLKIKDLFRLQR